MTEKSSKFLGDSDEARAIIEVMGGRPDDLHKSRLVGKAKSGPCEQGETSANTGCVPASGGGGKKPGRSLADIQADMKKLKPLLTSAEPGSSKYQELYAKYSALRTEAQQASSGPQGAPTASSMTPVSTLTQAPAGKSPPKKPANKLPKLDRGYVGKPIPSQPTKTPHKLMEYSRGLEENVDENTFNLVKSYTGASDYLNMRMRSCPPDFNCLNKGQRAVLDAVNSLAEKKLPEPVVVWRGITMTGASSMQTLLDSARKAASDGTEFMMPCITSTSFDPTNEFMKAANVVFRIVARTGIPAEGFTEVEDEQELIQSPRTRYRVVAVDQADGPGKITGKVEKKHVIYLEERE